jgi:MFS family permease
MIAIPWLLVSTPSGATTFGYVAIVMTMISFLIAPSIGHIVDKYSRKRILLLAELMGLVVILFFALIGFTGVEYQGWHYMILYGIGTLYYTLFYPAIFAFNQEIFDPSTYRALNGAMEIQGQLSSMLAGAIAAILISKVDLQWLLFFDALTYLCGLLLFIRIPYEQTANVEQRGGAFFKKLKEGIHYMKTKPSLFFFLMASVMPFIGVMLTNYLFPIHLNSVLKVDAGVYGMQSMLYGVGAVLAGVVIPMLAAKRGNMAIIISTVFLYTVGITWISFVESVPIYLILTMLLAFGNAGTRVARNSYMMDEIPNQLIGRVDSLFRTIGLGLRIVLLAVFTKLAGNGDIQIAFYILFSFMILSVGVVICSKMALNKKAITYVRNTAQ